MAKSLLTVKIKKRKSILPRGADSKHMGPEPEWDDIAFLNESEIRSREMIAYNWYNYFYEPKEGRKFIVEFMQENEMSRAAMTMFNRLPDSQISSSLAASARMYTMGYQTDERKAKIEQGILKMCRAGAELLKQDKKQTVVEKAPNHNVLIAHVEDLIDGDNVPESFYNWLKEKDAKPTQARAIAEYYRPWLEELQEAATTKDQDLKEAYRHLNKKQLKERIAMFEQLVADCEALVSNNRKSVVRKPRKTKPKSADKIVSRIKFQKEDTNLKIVSIDPAKIVGAKELWTFNTKTNVLSHYVSSIGLTVKGTTLQSFTDSSKQKKLRKPADALSSIIQSTPKAAERAFESLTTKASNPNGRINEQTVILRAVK